MDCTPGKRGRPRRLTSATVATPVSSASVPELVSVDDINIHGSEHASVSMHDQPPTAPTINMSTSIALTELSHRQKGRPRKATFSGNSQHRPIDIPQTTKLLRNRNCENGQPPHNDHHNYKTKELQQRKRTRRIWIRIHTGRTRGKQPKNAISSPKQQCKQWKAGGDKQKETK